jgi:hypothetical protein
MKNKKNPKKVYPKLECNSQFGNRTKTEKWFWVIAGIILFLLVLKMIL